MSLVIAKMRRILPSAAPQWARRVVPVVLIAVPSLVAAAFALMLALADHGAFDDRIAHWASARLGRTVRFRRIGLHLLSRTPGLTIDGLVVANPGWIGKGDLAEVDRITADVELLPMLAGKLRPRALTVSGAHLHLVRFGPGRNNWTFTDHPRPGPAFAPLADVTRLSIVQSRIDIKDYGRDLHLAGAFGHAPTGARPFAFRAAGLLKGYAVSVAVTGGQLDGPGVGPAWPFHAHLVDAATVVDAQGVSAQPFDLSRFDLGMASTGPNLADLGYLFNLAMPNSGPYRLATRAKTDGEHFGFSNITGVVGQSDVVGTVRSDHSGRRRRVIAVFRARTLARADVDALLAPIPPRAEARRSSGIVKAVATGRWILPDATFGVTRLRAGDFDLSVTADRTIGYALPLRAVSTRIVLVDGLLRFPRFDASLYGGTVAADGQLDARSGVPRIAVEGALRGARLDAIAPGHGQPADARLDLSIAITGTGASVHEAAGTARGTATGRLVDAAMPRRAAWILGGDLLRAVGNVGSKDAPGTLAVTCAAGSVRSGGDGRFAITALGIRTPLGTARGSGAIDLGRERIDLLLQGQPATKRLLQVAAPVRVEGPLLAPTLTLLPGRKARALGLKGTLGLALTPIAGLLPIKGKATALPMAPDAGC